MKFVNVAVVFVSLCFRAIFLWLCSKDLSKLNFDNVQKGSPEEILMSLQRGQTTYAVVFEILCRYQHCCVFLLKHCVKYKYKSLVLFRFFKFRSVHLLLLTSTTLNSRLATGNNEKQIMVSGES